MSMQASKIKQGMKDGAVVGTWIQTNNPAAVEVCGYVGMDFVILDMEHGNFGPDSCLNMIRAAEATNIDAIVRVPTADLQYTKNALDWGAMGVLVPQLKSGAEAKAFVEQARFEGTDGGKRGGCPWIRCNQYNNLSYYGEYVKWCNENRQMWALIEHPKAIEDIEAMAKSGLDVFVMGPFDMSNAMGYEGNVRHPEVVKAMNHMIDVATKNGVHVCCTMFSSEAAELRSEAAEWKKRGVDFFSCLSPEALLQGCFKTFNDACRSK